ncbi:MAG: NYN domain-containing protein [Magnetococcales bacterium]|nr:NYN domain-containing protein [Magnetococcales bacterium]
MDRYAIFVDAGYFFKAGAEAATGLAIPLKQTLTRKQVSVKSPRKMLDDLCQAAAAMSDNLPLLRVYWYDAMPGLGATLEQSVLASLAGVKLRLGALNSAGKQKGVDSLIVTDIIDLARNRAISDAVVVTGDEDLRIAFQVAQSFGVRVHILAAGDPTRNVSLSLQMEADSVTALDSAWFTKHFDLSTPAPQMPTNIPPTTQITGLEAAAKEVISGTLANMKPDQLTQLAAHFTTKRTIPSDIDGPFIAKVAHALSGQRLTGTEMRHIRGMFITSVHDLIARRPI